VNLFGVTNELRWEKNYNFL